MQRKNNFLLIVAILLMATYAYFFTDWFSAPRIQIISQLRPSGRGGVDPVSFSFDGLYRLTSVKVVPLTQYQTNKYATPIWHLVSPSNSAPIPGFLYGSPIRGMVPAVTNSHPAGLEPDTAYRLLVEAGKARGHIDFHTRAVAQP